MPAPEGTTITIRRPDDMHLHVRDGAVVLKDILRHVTERFDRAIIMPNLKPPVTKIGDADAYRGRIEAALTGSARRDFTPLMTLYLTDNTSPEDVRRVKECDFVYAFKYYPAGATTNSDSGVTDVRKVYPTIEAMQEHKVPLLLHGEVTDADVDIFDREAVFIERILTPLARDFPELPMVLEHVTSKNGVDFVRSAGAHMHGTITAHHLYLTRNELLVGGIRPHHFCLPVVKTIEDRDALREAAASDDPSFFAGTDSAPHAIHNKETACGAAGVYTSHAAIELYAEALDDADALERLEDFASMRGANFYGLPPATRTQTLVKRAREIPDRYNFGHDQLVPFRAGSSVAWSLA